jgi:hypothetical protein
MGGRILAPQIVQVEPGTVIKEGALKHTVTDENCVMKGAVMYVTPLVFRTLRTGATP